MRGDGLRQVNNPSELLLTDRHEGMSGIAIASTIEGIRPFLIETQALVSTAAYGTPQRSATGFDLRRMNMLLAVLEKRVGFKLAQKDVFLNIAGGLRAQSQMYITFFTVHEYMFIKHPYLLKALFLDKEERS